MNDEFAIGQFWSSEAERNLGVGEVVNVGHKTVELFFKASNERRCYSKVSSPLLREKNTATTKGVPYPIELLLKGHTDPLERKFLRLKIQTFNSAINNSKVRGFVGGRIDLLPHQLYIADAVSARRKIKVMLADETGLGKTIEACLILHRLLLIGKISKVIIIVPSHLVNQWFVELLRRFNLLFTILTADHDLTGSSLFISDIDSLATNKELTDKVTNTKWDMVILDEAHHLEIGSDKFSIFKNISKTSNHLLLLTATPEQCGRKSHFALLNLLDEFRYISFEKFENERLFNNTLLTKIESLILNNKYDSSALPTDVLLDIDIYGVGQSIFRNTRRNIPGFPARRVIEYKLTDIDFKKNNVLTSWLIEFCKKLPNTKKLLICNSKEKVIELQLDISKEVNIDIAVFHEDMTILQRDRNAAWFSEITGANLLISSEIGSEGRNFQFCQDLILLDLPEHPELLEQRIGRLDRIGQKGVINIHIPYLVNSIDENIFKWHNYGLNSLSQNNPAAGQVYELLKPTLNFNDGKIEELISSTTNMSIKISEEITNSRDRLLELSSHQSAVSNELIVNGKDKQIARSTEIVMGELFRLYGIEIEDCGDQKFLLLTDYLVDNTFPLPRKSKPIITFNRNTALLREDVEFITIDHPMLLGAVELFLSSHNGRSVIACWKETKEATSIFEFNFIIQVIGSERFNLSSFFPVNMVRTVIDINGSDVTNFYSSINLKSLIIPSNSIINEIVKQNIEEVLLDSYEKALQISMLKSKSLIEEATILATNQYKSELNRIDLLKKRYSINAFDEISSINMELSNLLSNISAAKLELDSITVIVPNKVNTALPDSRSAYFNRDLVSEFD